MLTDYLYKNAVTIPDRPFLVWEDRQFSYAAMARMVTRCVAQLTEGRHPPGRLRRPDLREQARNSSLHGSR